MNLVGRIFRLVWGGDVDRALRPVLAVGLIGSIAGSSAYPFRKRPRAIRAIGAGRLLADSATLRAKAFPPQVRNVGE